MKRTAFISILITILLILFLNKINSQFKSPVGINGANFEIIVSASPVPVMKFENKIDENSGIIFFRDLFWTFNDSGGENSFYSFDSVSGMGMRKYIVANANNVDWEDIAQDNEYIYIGDFGNNFGNRTNLVVYKIFKKFISNVNNGLVVAEEIRFKYEDQIDFTPLPKITEYDCEAFISYNDYLYLFTKDWLNRKTKVYKLPKEAGDYNAELMGSFNVDGLVTGADISPDGRSLAILGYKEYTPYMIMFSSFIKDDFFSGRNKYYNFSSIHNAQTEGISFTTNNTIYISCESSGYEAQLFRLNISE